MFLSTMNEILCDFFILAKMLQIWLLRYIHRPSHVKFWCTLLDCITFIKKTKQLNEGAGTFLLGKKNVE